jgi:PhoPQ-activated pathogenicity-related protein
MLMRQRWSALVILASATLCTSAARAGLDEYVKKPDAAYAWTTVETSKLPDGTTLRRIKLTSQVWEGTTWTHTVSVIEPAVVSYPDAMLLFITGGAIGDGPRKGDIATGLAMAKACRARVAVLPQVPNQPLLGGKTEDALIAETFIRYLDTKDADWPLLFPMVKSAVRAMDAMQALGKEINKPVERFVVSGASKRGWTTWLTAAVDPRVKGFAPMVIPTLNLPAQNRHQLENFGKYSQEIGDYSERGLMDALKTPEGKKLDAMVDPYTYRSRYTMPSLQINGTNDPYWTLDSLNIYWNDLPGPKWVVYLPNAVHNLDQHRDYATEGVGALFRYAIGNRPLPKLKWQLEDESGTIKLRVESDTPPKSVTLWEATSESLDFRKSKWTSTSLDPKPVVIAAERSRPASGNIALFADLEYQDGDSVFHLSTQIRQTNHKPAQ